MQMTPENEALAFRIWQFAEPKEWDVTPKEIAEHLNISYQHVGYLLSAKKWSNRVRTNVRDMEYAIERYR